MTILTGLAVVLSGQAVASARLVPASDTIRSRLMVAVVRAREADGACQEVATRIVAELMAEGVPVMALTCATVDVACLASSEAHAEATILVRRWGGVPGVEVHAGETVRSHRESPLSAGADSGRVQRLSESDSGGGPSALAVRTVERLRAMLLERADLREARPAPSVSPTPPVVRRSPQVTPTSSLSSVLPEAAGPSSSSSSSALAAMASRGPSASSSEALLSRADEGTAEQELDPEPIVKVSRVSALPSAPAGPRKIVVTLGVAMIGSFSGLSAAYGPALRIGRRASDHVDLSLFLAGPAFARDQQNLAGSVTVRQEMIVLEADLLAMPWRGVAVRTGAGMGLYHIQVDGHTADFGSIGRSAGGSSLAVSWSAGVIANLRPDLGLYLDARLFLVTPTPVILLNGVEVGRTGDPGIVVTSGIELRI